MNLNRQQMIALSVFVAVGVIALFNLWWLLVPAALIGAGTLGYMYRRALGRVNEAVQVGLWAGGLGLVLLLSLNLFVGVLLLAGASLLLRGREAQADQWVQQTIARFSGRSVGGSYPIQQVPINQTPVTHVPIIEEPSQPRNNETTRL